MSIYTFILDYLGGTYVSQVVSSDEFSAMHLWIEKLESIVYIYDERLIK